MPSECESWETLWLFITNEETARDEKEQVLTTIAVGHASQ